MAKYWKICRITNDKNIQVQRISVNNGRNSFRANQKNQKNSLTQWRDKGGYNKTKVVSNNYKEPNEIYMKEVVYFNTDDNGQRYFKHY